MAYIELPFSLPCHLSFTSHIRGTGSHATGNAIDISPLIQGVDERTKTAIYLKAYLILWSHLSQNRLRINIAKNNRHFHFEIKPDVWEFGYEQYEARTRTVMVGATPKQEVYEVSLSEPVNYDATKPGANLRFAAMLSAIEKLWVGYFPGLGGTVESFLQLIKQVTLDDYSPARIYYDEKKISRETAERFASQFKSDVLWLPSSNYNPWKPQDIIDGSNSITGFFSSIKWLAIAGGAFYLISRLPSDKTDR